MQDKVKCADCGYLAVRVRRTRLLFDAEQDYRDSGSIPSIGNEGIYDPAPICFVRAINISAEYKPADGTPERQKIVQKERDCQEFTEWQQGLTPKEHLEMNLLEQQQQRLDKREKEDRNWRLAQAEREREWRNEDVQLAKDAMKVSIRSYLVAATIGFVGALAAVALARLLKV
jgi:hypothetical protein